MRYSIIAILILLCSCGTDNSQENESLKRKVAELERTIDSLRIEIALLKTPPPKTTTKTKKKSNTKNTNNQTYGVTIQQPQKVYSKPAPQSLSYSGQCMATTKKGSRCSRKGKSNGYCWQHGG